MKNSFLIFLANLNPLFTQSKKRINQLETFLSHSKHDFEQEIDSLKEKISELEEERKEIDIEEKQAEVDRLQNLLNNTVNLLGKEDVKDITDLEEILDGQTLVDLVKTKEMFSEKISDLEDQMMKLARQKIKLNKSGQEKLNLLLENHQKEKEELKREQGSEKEEMEAQILSNTEKIKHLEDDLKTAKDLLDKKEIKSNLEEFRQYLIASYVFLQKTKEWLEGVRVETSKTDSIEEKHIKNERAIMSIKDKYNFFFTSQIETNFQELLEKEGLWNKEIPKKKKVKKGRG